MGSAVAGEMLEWFRSRFGFEEAQKARTGGGADWDRMMALAAASPPGAKGAMFLPHLSGATIPVPDADSTGAFVGLRAGTTKGDLVRAVVEGLNYQALQIFAGLEQGLHVRPERFVAAGGGTANAFWMQNKADMLGKAIEVPDIEEATPLGAAILAGIGVGVYADEQDAYERVRKPGRVYEPDRSLTAKYAEGFDTFRKIYPALKGLNAGLRALA